MPFGGYPSGALTSGTTVRNPILSEHVFASGLHKPEHSKFLTFKYPQYYMTALLDKLDAGEPVAQTNFSWSVMDRTRKNGTISSLTATGSSTITFEVTEYDFVAASNLGYVIPGDVLRFQSGALGRVTTVVVSTVLSAKAKVTVEKVDGTNWSAPDLADTQKFGRVFNAFAEGTAGPVGRLYLPAEDSNNTTILKAGVSVTGSELTNMTWLGDGRAFYWTVEDIMLKEFARDRELLVMFGDRSGSASTVKVTRGILDWVLSEGVTNTYASAAGVSENDIQDHLRDLLVEGGSSEYLVLCGATFYQKAQRALRDYQIHNSTNYGQIGQKMAGLAFKGYEFMGKKAYFVHYEVFNDTAILPFTGTPSASFINFDEFSLWLDLGRDDSGRRLINLKYKQLGNINRKYIYKIVKGMIDFEGSTDGFASNTNDSIEVSVLSEIGVEFRNANRCGILRANS